jgi:AcrR family transcriptional regulator
LSTNIEGEAGEGESGPMPRNLPRERPGPVGGKRDENRRRRVREISEAALALFLEKGVEGVTVDEIVRDAKIAKGSFYRYFSDKTDLVEALFAPLVAQLRVVIGEAYAALSHAEDNDALIAAYGNLAQAAAAAIFEHSGVVLLYLQENRAPGVGARAPIRRVADELSQGALDLTRAARKHGLLRPFPAQVSALAVIGAVERLLFGLLAGEDVGDPAELAQSLISLILDGLRADR